jgi:ferredoxin
MTKVTVDAETCIGCGACASICPDAYEMGSDGKSHAKDGAGDAACAQQGADACPVGAIKVE